MLCISKIILHINTTFYEVVKLLKINIQFTKTHVKFSECLGIIISSQILSLKYRKDKKAAMVADNQRIATCVTCIVYFI